MASTRYVSLDVLRGIAILGTLGTNIWIYTNPAGLIGYLRADSSGPWRGVEIVLQQLTQGKFLGLLTIMFGIGLALQRRSAIRVGYLWPGSYPWRAALLLVDGIIHFVLMTEFDVLMGYAITGWIVPYLLITSERTQRRTIAAAAAIHVGLLTLITAALLAVDTGAPAEPAAVRPNPYADGTWWDLVVFRLDNALLFRAETILIFPMSVALFLLGARLFDAGVLEAGGHRLRRRLMWVGFGVALPIDFVLEVWVGFPGLLISRYATAPVVSLGILAAVAEYYVRRTDRCGVPGPVGRQLATVGRMALSSYVLQNLAASAICYGWGLGVAGAIAPQHRVPVTIAVYLVVVALVVAFARAWLSRFERGPVEWLWNSSYRALTSRTASVRECTASAARRRTDTLPRKRVGVPPACGGVPPARGQGSTGTDPGSTRCQSPSTRSTTYR